MMIRKMLVCDIPEVSSLWFSMVKEADKNMLPNIHWWKMHCERLLASGIYCGFVAEENNKLIGFIDMFSFPEPATSKMHAVGQHFYVVPEHRGNSVSGKLWRAILRESKKLDCDILELYCFDSQRDFWEKHGFKQKRNLMRRGEKNV